MIEQDVIELIWEIDNDLDIKLCSIMWDTLKVNPKSKYALYSLIAYIEMDGARKCESSLYYNRCMDARRWLKDTYEGL